MNIRGVDLNLLTILHALLEEAHVSRAARRLAMSQPATSSALERCRRLFDDPLLERTSRTMRLTAKADALRQPLADIMADIGALVAADMPDLKDIRQTVRLVMADALGSLLAPVLHEAVVSEAPGINLVLHPWGGGQPVMEALARGTVDMAVSVLPQSPDYNIHAEPLGEVKYMVAMRENHPASLSFDLQYWLEWPHIIVSANGSTQTAVDMKLAAMGLERKVGMVVPSFLAVPSILRRSNMIALLPVGAAVDPFEQGLRLFDPPVAIEGFSLGLAWHRRLSRDRAVQFVADKIRLLAAEIASISKS